MFRLRSLPLLRAFASNISRIRLFSSVNDSTLYHKDDYYFNYRKKHEKYDLLTYDLIRRNSFAIINDVCGLVLSKRLDANQLPEMEEFQRECQLLCDQIGFISDSRLVSLLQTLLMTYSDHNIRLISLMENEVLWRANKLPFKLLIKCLNYHVRYQNTDQQKKVLNELIFNIQSHLDNASDVDDIIHLFRLSKHFTEECVRLIEETALQMIVYKTSDNFVITSHSLCYLLVLLSQLNRRPTPLIRAIVYKLIDLPMEEAIGCKEVEKLTHLINTVRALKSLNFADNNLLKKICDILCNRHFIDKVSPAFRRDLLTTIGLLNYCHSRVIDCFIERIINNTTFFRARELATVVVNAARLYYQPTHMQEIIPTYITPYIKPSDIDSYSWLTYVWSLAIFESASSYHISSVLSDEFCDKLLAEKNNFEKTISKLKLLNIKAVAEIEMGLEIDAPKCLMTDLEMPKRQHDVELLRTSILDAFNSFIPKNLYMATNVITPFGFTIDAEFIIDSSLNPLKLSEYGIFGANANINNNLKEVPNGYKRVAVLSIGYNDTLLDSNHLIGTNQLIVRILEKLNYTVLIVNQNHFSSNICYAKRIINLQILINNLFKPIY